MKKITAFLHKYQVDLLFVLLLLALTFFAWLPLLGMIIRGNGYMYMLASVQNWFWGRAWTLTGFESAAAISGWIFGKFYGAQISLYLWTELVAILVIGVLFYLFVRVLTKKSIVAFSAALIFSVNYFGNFDMLVRPCYCYFMERVLNVPLLLASLIFLELFLERRGIFFLISLILYFVGIGLGHFSFFFTGIFLFYPFFWYLFRTKKAGWLTGIGVGLSYLGISLFFLLVQQIDESGFGSSWTFQEFFLNPQKYHYFEYMVRQLVYWSQYPPILGSFFRIPFEHQNLVNIQNAISITPYVVFVYILAFFVIYKKLSRQRAMLFAIVFATAAIFYLNAYFGQYAIARSVSTNRYLYFPTFLLAIFWSFFLWALCWKRNSWKVSLGIVILICYYVVNTTLLRDNFKSVSEWDKPTKAIFQFIITTRSRLSNDTLVLLQYPTIIGQEARFLTEQIGEGEVHYMSDDLSFGDWRPLVSQTSHVIKLRYDKDCECVKEETIK